MNLTSMRSSIVLALLVMTASSFAEDTAYSALRVVKAKHGEEALNRVIEVRGHGGAWKIVLADSRARAGVREIHVLDGRITSESKPTRTRQPSAPMDLKLLNLDSDGVLTTVNLETKETVPSELIDYTLSNGADGNTPVWRVELHNQGEGKVTSMQIAADTGNIVEKSVTPLPDDAQVVIESGEEQVEGKQTSSRSRQRSRGAPDVVENVVRHVERAGSLLRRFLP